MLYVHTGRTINYKEVPVQFTTCFGKSNLNIRISYWYFVFSVKANTGNNVPII